MAQYGLMHASIHTGLAGATYRIEGIDQAYDHSVTTGHSGVAVVEELFSGSYKIYEENPPEGYLPSNEVQTIHYDGEREIENHYAAQVNHDLYGGEPA